ncbi:type II toxin-antitoxin system RelE/ParE family toxin [Roseovarius aestuarii]|uniref:type II toxin-antitoxin system RelE/ParE family toxin n=1 Tax=Roseovarius aestuarii TaxID=475083 RepID=UPI0024680F74|nr:type II toxin-antitoxin system RelE/ParE family toxin [Roseovarius aestuarii]
MWIYTETNLGSAQAVTHLTALDAAFSLLAEFPEITRKRDGFTPPVHIHPHREHPVIYRRAEWGIDILRIMHKRTNWSELLTE